ncbi:MAG TPA: type II secretion system F family protein [Candidatus Paceibacterota bacterium]|nr:type II secretion system F family protein [Candidatus Pacearchaeota archaeon]HRZ50880.1 type II secretion system F family protein [Candidatus Paceibacterota bacterium]HSA36601.1 type II secretion system F family protein [Candidatus Paceibacterota bacterium]
MRFTYQARTKIGDVKIGVIDASSKKAAIDMLQRDGLFVTQLRKESESFSKRFRLMDRISGKEVAIFSRQLAVMFKANVSLVESLRTIGGQFTNQSFREKILKISQDVEAGTSLSNAFAKYPDIFSSFFIAMIKAGEVSGNLSEQLTYLADYLEKNYYLSGKIKGAMVYPALIVIVVIAVLFMLSYFVLPNLLSTLTETGAELPLITQIVIVGSNFIRGPGGLLLILGMVLIMIFAMRYYKSDKGRIFFDKLFLRVPVFSSLLRMVYLSRFADNLSTLVSGGIPITQSLEITGNIVGNIVYKEVILKTRDGVRRGQTISSILYNYPELFPPMFTQMILVGEQTGSLDKSLSTLVNFYEKESDSAIDGLLTLIEPVLIILLGVIVGGIVAAVMIPMYSSLGNM